MYKCILFFYRHINFICHLIGARSVDQMCGINADFGGYYVWPSRTYFLGWQT